MAENIEIRKAGFTNKGAEMMLVAATQQIQARVNGAKVVVAPNYTLPYQQRIALGLWHRAEVRKLGFDFGAIVSLVPKKLRERYGFVTSDEVNIIFDAAGFAYSDQWGDAPTEDLAKRAKRWRQQGKKLVLLPQAFGPFESKAIQESLKEVVKYAALIFARDKQSYEHLTGVVGEMDKIRMCPDFTNLLKPKPAEFQIPSNSVAIVPNARMLDKTDGAQSNSYIAFLAKAIELCEGAGLKPFFLIHESIDDLALAEDINRSRKKPLFVISPEDALRAKDIISQCEALIGSRFHALVSALAQAKPVVGTGWSHKYAELFGDYKYSEGLINSIDDIAAIEKGIEPLLSEVSRAALSSRLAVESDRIKQEVGGMWDLVFQKVNQK